MLNTDAPPKSETTASLGEKLRGRRKEMGLTLDAVAKRAGVTTGFISQVERNITSPSLSSLTALAAALDAHITDFFEPPPKPEETSRADLRNMYASPGDGFQYERLSTSFPGSTMNGLLLHIPPECVLEEMVHEGEEFYYVLKGALTLVIDGRRSVLGVGDSVHFDSMRRHAVLNETKKTVTVLVANTMDVFGEAQGDAPDG